MLQAVSVVAGVEGVTVIHPAPVMARRARGRNRIATDWPHRRDNWAPKRAGMVRPAFWQQRANRWVIVAALFWAVS
ncbi:hypothetical protein GCM10011320_48050 [Neoroseomonas lacus]|uniref:Uncharacterized protein n=1 Tax=Neoroseomonas lacus TaxID=287609 RepID=A0A917NW10_9PROT|nr:hypothetical protein GCM10011320_48050 [Neoroseomonas lacus]